MPPKKSANDNLPSVQEAANTLAKMWVQVSEEDKPSGDPNIDKLIRCKTVAIRYALPTQLLGKCVAPVLDALCLQKGGLKGESLWDPRTFARKVIVPWVTENQSVLGTSQDPYVSNPLRRPRLEATPEKSKSAADTELWKLLYTILSEAQSDSSGEKAKTILLEVLRTIHVLLKEQTFEYVVPQRMSIDQVLRLLDLFLSESSGGDRGLSVAAAFFETLKTQLGIYSEIRRHVINASDASTGLAGDIECVGHDGEIKLAIEVKEREITLADLQSATLKARKISLQELLLNAPGYAKSESEDIEEHVSKAWASGTSIYRLSITEMTTAILPILGQAGIIEFITNIGKQLDKFRTQPHHRSQWKELLENV